MRRIARESVFKLLFEFSFYGEPNNDSLELVLLADDLSDDDKDYIKRTYLGTAAKFEELKTLISENLDNYKIERLYRPDLIVLILAAYELSQKEVPEKVIINEAVDLAKKYGTEKSGAFVNGVLARLIKA